MNFRFYSLLIGISLLLSAVLPGTKEVWAKIDIAFFQAVNPWLANESFGTFVALLNSRLGDWISHLAFAALLVSSLPLKKKGLYSLIGMVILVVFIQLFVNYYIFKSTINYLKDSPSLSVEHFVDIEKRFPFPNNHSTTARSFPGDHSTTLFLCSTWVLLTGGKRLLLPILALATLFSFPRLMAGAHGLSDVIAGAGAITLILLPFIIYFHRLVARLPLSYRHEKSHS